MADSCEFLYLLRRIVLISVERHYPLPHLRISSNRLACGTAVGLVLSFSSESAIMVVALSPKPTLHDTYILGRLGVWIASRVDYLSGR